MPFRPSAAFRPSTAQLFKHPASGSHLAPLGFRQPRLLGRLHAGREPSQPPAHNHDWCCSVPVISDAEVCAVWRCCRIINLELPRAPAISFCTAAAGCELPLHTVLDSTQPMQHDPCSGPPRRPAPAQPATADVLPWPLATCCKILLTPRAPAAAKRNLKPHPLRPLQGLVGRVIIAPHTSKLRP